MTFFGKPPKNGQKFYLGSSTETPWTQHLHARMFIDDEDTFTDMARKGLAPRIRARNPLNPYRQPDPVVWKPPPNIKKVSMPTSTGLRHIGPYHEHLPTHRKNEETYQLMREMNETLRHELGDVKRYLLDTSRRVAALESNAGGITRSRGHSRAKTAMGSHRSHQDGGKRRKVPQMKTALWDPVIKKSLPVSTPSTVYESQRGKHTYPAGPLAKY